MPKRIPLNGTVVIRDGKRVRPQIGKEFDYTADEIKDLENGGAKFAKAGTTTEDAEPATASTSARGGKPAKAGKAPSSAEKSQSGARGGKKDATANKSDEEANEDESQDDDL